MAEVLGVKVGVAALLAVLAGVACAGGGGGGIFLAATAAAPAARACARATEKGTGAAAGPCSLFHLLLLAPLCVPPASPASCFLLPSYLSWLLGSCLGGVEVALLSLPPLLSCWPVLPPSCLWGSCLGGVVVALFYRKTV